MTFSDLRLLILRSFTQPRDVARVLIALRLPAQARWTALCLVMVLSSVLSLLVELVMRGVTGEAGEATSVSTILVMTAVQGALILYGAAAMTVLGRQAGGQGTFAEAMVLVSWAEFILILGQCAQFVLMLVVPQLTMIGAAALIALLFYLLTQFTAALHGFTSLIKVAMAVIAVFFGTAMIAGMIFVSLGLVPAQI
ncbi:YIP1 family protein [Paenirhodobacter enshiensis]|uniref:YIP1 family protein n=1 Tax=Paenirhodobacter enshiensis TaxID=1105367 RepID=UPI003FA2A9D8